MVRKREEILVDMKKAVETQDVESAKKLAKEAIDAGMKPLDAIENGYAKGMLTISDMFDRAEIFLPEILLSADAITSALGVLKPKMAEEEKAGKGTIVIGTVAGDIHEVGKNVVTAMLNGSGYNTIDLGRDVPVEKFIQAAQEHNAVIIAASALMTTTMLVQKEIIQGLKEAGLREKFKTMFGGAPCYKEWVEEIGGDGYGANATEALAVSDKLVRRT